MRLPIERLRPVATRAAFIVALVAAFVLLVRSDALHGAFLGVLDATRDVIAQYPVGGPLAFLALAAASAMLGFFSSAVLVPAAVYAWGAVPTMLLLWLGWTVGGIIAWSLAARLGRPVIRWLVPEATFLRYRSLLDKRPRFRTVLLLQVAFPSEIVGYLLGLARYPLPRYLAALVLAELPWVVGTVLLGVGFVERDVVTLLAVSVVGATALLLIAQHLRRRQVSR